MQIPSGKINIYPKNEENLKALLSYYFEVELGDITYILESDFTINQLEFIAEKTSEHTSYLNESLRGNGNASNFMKYGIDAITTPENSWSGSKNRNKITKGLKDLIHNHISRE